VRLYIFCEEREHLKALLLGFFFLPAAVRDKNRPMRHRWQILQNLTYMVKSKNIKLIGNRGKGWLYLRLRGCEELGSWSRT
jgi:hypothetical protein